MWEVHSAAWLSLHGGVQITTVDEAKQFYPLFGLGANVALIFSGRAVKYFSNVSPAPFTLWGVVLCSNTRNGSLCKNLQSCLHTWSPKAFV